jgi:hypothetical protein
MHQSLAPCPERGTPPSSLTRSLHLKRPRQSGSPQFPFSKVGPYHCEACITWFNYIPKNLFWVVDWLIDWFPSVLITCWCPQYQLHLITIVTTSSQRMPAASVPGRCWLRSTSVQDQIWSRCLVTGRWGPHKKHAIWRYLNCIFIYKTLYINTYIYRYILVYDISIYIDTLNKYMYIYICIYSYSFVCLLSDSK